MTDLRHLWFPLLLFARTTIAADLYVAPDGHDAWSGRSVTAADTNGPFATLERARDEVRALKKAGALGTGVTVHVRAGLYALPHTLKLDGNDAGSADAPIVYRGYEAERPTLTGGPRRLDSSPALP